MVGIDDVDCVGLSEDVAQQRWGDNFVLNFCDVNRGHTSIRSVQAAPRAWVTLVLAATAEAARMELTSANVKRMFGARSG